jgi:hypothetical protein
VRERGEGAQIGETRARPSACFVSRFRCVSQERWDGNRASPSRRTARGRTRRSSVTCFVSVWRRSGEATLAPLKHRVVDPLRNSICLSVGDPAIVALSQ